MRECTLCDHYNTLLEKLPGRLEALSPEAVEIRPADSWSAKEELGHLLDSAANNHQRIVRAQLEDNPAMPGYDGPTWVRLHAYQKRDWQELIGTWEALNRQLLAAAEAVPELSVVANLHGWRLGSADDSVRI